MKPWLFLDKLLWKVARWATSFIIRPLVFIGITPNQLTTLSAVINISLAVYCFSRGIYRWNLIGLFFLLAHSYFDFADGSLARATGKVSKLGVWLDPKLDIVGSEAVIVSIVFGIIRFSPTPFWLIVIFLAIFGRIGILAVVFDYCRTVYGSRDFVDQFKKDHQMTKIDGLIKEFITLNSFPFLFLGTLRYSLFLAIIFNQLKWFLLVIAVFNNLRWMIMFWAYAMVLGDRKKNFRVIKLLKKHISE